MSLIRTEHLSHQFPAEPAPVAALDDVSVSFDRGEYLAIIGANGSGKSTLARHLNALLLPTIGDVWVEEWNTRDPVNLRAIRHDVAMVFQNPENQFVATVAQEDVAFGPENFGEPPPEIKARVNAAISAVDLDALRTRAPHELSAGQQQRLAIAGALALEPAALLLDEATSMLDPRGKRAVMDLAARLNSGGLALAAITQSMEEAAEAGRIIVMSQGRIVTAGTPREVFSEPERLHALDLDLPPLAEIAHALAARISGFPAGLLTLDELVEAIVERQARNLERETTNAKALGHPSVLGERIPTDLKRFGDHPGVREPIIQTIGLKHTYLRGTPRATEALREVNVEIFYGEIVGIIGSAGSGKSTLLQHFNGLIRPRPADGKVIVDGVDLSDANADMRALRRRVGLVFQFSERQLFERYVGDDIAFGPRQYGYDKMEVRRRVQGAMAKVGLDFEGFKDRVTRTLSGGQKRRAALAGVLALEPKVLVLDEPTAGLDPRSRREFLASLQKWREEEGLTVVIVSHHMEEIAQVCDRVYVMEDGRVAFSGSPRDLFASDVDLDRLGLIPPPVVRLSRALVERGVKLSGKSIDMESIVEELTEVIGE